MTGPGPHDPRPGDGVDAAGEWVRSEAVQPHGRAVDLTPTPARPAHPRGGASDGAPDGAPDEATDATHGGRDDPLRLCVFATVALIAWLAGPWAVLGFAGLGFAGYWRARRHGLLRSRCLLGDTRLVLLYLGLLVAVAAWGAWRSVA
ncbi:hypothetical protein [Terracoccus luteus]|uniref:Uncharacterized protein n=1 Tax=Terracoccus luteus TaxID=53356 RepID=A0A839Q1Q5_9MICO|nr:hypothetical protein [Terracoccus luteus]MBB2988196.1 hypothetical protein [Terracoccus luteus]MCP2173831.1 hypothetical protein [Terracoccus luteus]